MQVRRVGDPPLTVLMGSAVEKEAGDSSPKKNVIVVLFPNKQAAVKRDGGARERERWWVGGRYQKSVILWLVMNLQSSFEN